MNKGDLENYDPQLFEVINNFFKGFDWKPSSPEIQ